MKARTVKSIDFLQISCTHNKFTFIILTRNQSVVQKRVCFCSYWIQKPDQVWSMSLLLIYENENIRVCSGGGGNFLIKEYWYVRLMGGGFVVP